MLDFIIHKLICEQVHPNKKVIYLKYIYFILTIVQIYY